MIASRATKKVCMVVYNSVSHDGRVLKEAASLVQAGYDVAIVGLIDGRDHRPQNQLDNGVRIIRLSHSSLGINAQQLRKRRFLRLGFLSSVIALIIGLGCRFVLGWGISVPIELMAGVAGIGILFLKLFPIARWMRLRQWANQVFRQLEIERPDVVHCHDAQTLSIGGSYRRKFPCRLVYDSHELPTHQSRVGTVRRLMVMAIQRRFCGDVDRFVTVNDKIAEHFAQTYKRLPKAVVVMNATVARRSQPDYDGRLHAAAGLDRSTKILLFQGGFALGRGLTNLIRSSQWYPDPWCLVLMGWGYLEPKLRQLAVQLPGDSDQIKFLPAVPQAELAQWTAGAALGTILYENTCLNHWYCSPNKLWEYPNAGVPILASRFPVLESIVDGNDLGWLLRDPVSPRDIAQLLAAISDDELAAKSASCRSFIQQNNWSIYEERLVQAYDSMTADARPNAESRQGPYFGRPLSSSKRLAS